MSFAARIACAAAIVALPALAVARECPLGRAVFEPIDAPGMFQMDVAKSGVGYRFTLNNRSLGRSTRFLGSAEGGTGYLNIDEDVGASQRQGILSRVVLFRANLKTTDAWNKGAVPVAYATFEKLSYELWQRARFNAEDDKLGSSPPDGLWRLARCRRR